MTGHIIDAKHRFSSDRATPSVSEDEETVRLQWVQRDLRQKSEAAELRSKLTSIPRLDPADRKVLARNLGRAIERHPERRSTQIAAELLRFVYGEDGGASREKKRKRYIRFDGEPLTDHGPGEEYAAHGTDFLRLAEGLAALMNRGASVDVAKDQMLLFVCDGASFYGPSRPQILQDVSLFDRFRQLMVGMVDRTVRASDVISYFDEAQHYTIKTHPEGLGDVGSDVMETLYRQTWPVERFEYTPGETASYDEYSRLRFGGFDIRAEGVSGLLPNLRIARIYWPMQVLCLPASVPTAQLRSIKTRELTSDETEEAWDQYHLRHLSREAYLSLAVDDWRARNEYKLWLGAIREAGFEPGQMDWTDFEDPMTGEALHGAVWRTYWEALSVDMHLAADGRPDALHLGLSFGGGSVAHWTRAPKSLLRPSDDDGTFMDRNFTWYHQSSSPFVPWYEDGERTFVARGLLHERDIPSEDGLGGETEVTQFGAENPGVFSELMAKPLWPLYAGQVWEILTMRMDDWKQSSYLMGFTKKQDLRPRLRPLFEAPSGWSPAPDGSLAAAIFRSLAYGKGAERLDEKLIAATNNLVRCFVDMKKGLSQDFDRALEGSGYGVE